jgi:DNA-binding transcriptional regulator YdaS (Cro superfamily)
MSKGIALDRFLSVRGNQKELAAELGIQSQAISQWRQVPLNRVLEVERVTGIPREQLRPDFFRTQEAAQ